MESYPEATPEQIEGAKKILRRRNIGILLMLLFVPSIGTLHQITGSDTFSMILAILFFSTIAGVLLSVAFVKCPRCEKSFFSKWYWSNGFALKCVHCGLKGKI